MIMMEPDVAWNPNENREVVLYDHFVGDNFSLKFIIKFRKQIMFFSLHFMPLSVFHTIIALKRYFIKNHFSVFIWVIT